MIGKTVIFELKWERQTDSVAGGTSYGFVPQSLIGNSFMRLGQKEEERILTVKRKIFAFLQSILFKNVHKILRSQN